MPAAASRAPSGAGQTPRPGYALATAVLGFFVVTLDAVIVNVALPAIRSDLGGGITGLQWVVDGYTLMFAALLLSTGSFTDRVGARRAFGVGRASFSAASLACGLAPTIGTLIAARVVQGAAAAVIMPSSMALIGHAYPDPFDRARAIGLWAMGGAVASSSGPVLGGVLTLVDWRAIFAVNIPVGILALAMLTRGQRSPHRAVPLDWVGQITAVTALSGLTYAAIEAGAAGFTDLRVVAALVVAAAASLAFITSQTRVAHPMVPLALFRSRNVSVAVVVGFAFVLAYYGLPFVMSLYLQQERGLSALGAGTSFLPMMLVGLLLTPFSARIAERVGAAQLLCAGLGTIVAGLVALAVVFSMATPAPVWVLAALMVPVGVGGPLVMPPVLGILLNSVPGELAGTASGVFNASRQVGGAMGVAVFGALLARQHPIADGVRTSMVLAALTVLGATVAALLLVPARRRGALPTATT